MSVSDHSILSGSSLAQRNYTTLELEELNNALEERSWWAMVESEHPIEQLPPFQLSVEDWESSLKEVVCRETSLRPDSQKSVQWKKQQNYRSAFSWRSEPKTSSFPEKYKRDGFYQSGSRRPSENRMERKPQSGSREFWSTPQTDTPKSAQWKQQNYKSASSQSDGFYQSGSKKTSEKWMERKPQSGSREFWSTPQTDTLKSAQWKQQNYKSASSQSDGFYQSGSKKTSEKWMERKPQSGSREFCSTPQTDTPKSAQWKQQNYKSASSQSDGFYQSGSKKTSEHSQNWREKKPEIPWYANLLRKEAEAARAHVEPMSTPPPLRERHPDTAPPESSQPRPEEPAKEVAADPPPKIPVSRWIPKEKLVPARLLKSKPMPYRLLDGPPEPLRPPKKHMVPKSTLQPEQAPTHEDAKVQLQEPDLVLQEDSLCIITSAGDNRKHVSEEEPQRMVFQGLRKMSRDELQEQRDIRRAEFLERTPGFRSKRRFQRENCQRCILGKTMKRQWEKAFTRKMENLTSSLSSLRL
ncbi:hypothetical protein DNTS_014867 [Danionella cerebrum]|uniref:Uncharacterized protein n=1 Tax=Danionella cerebrum TaxID=2873325 RepID=A0A553RCA5_9TELE|nr:hypothetical protein DNTS_014867 [Danionella translucida]